MVPSAEVCETYAAILLKPRRVEFKPGVWHMVGPSEICQAAAEALRRHHPLCEALEEMVNAATDAKIISGEAQHGTEAIVPLPACCGLGRI